MDFKINETTPITKTESIQTKEDIDINDDFSFALKRLTKDGLAERIDTLMKDITIQGERIAKHMDIKDLKQYRTLISEFINEVVTNSHEFSRENFLDRRGRHRVYGIVRKVNSELDELAQDLLQKEKDHIKILDRTDDIRGLLLDIII